MNKKIYYNNKFIGFDKSQTQTSQNQTIKVYSPENKQTLNNIIEDFLIETDLNSIIILNHDYETVSDFFKKQFSYIEAAGGFIENAKQYLFIHL